MAKVLVVDDDEAMRLALTRTLQAAGYETAPAVDGADALEQFRAAPADMVIVDLYMPGQEGLETLSQLRRDYPDVPVIVMSGNRNREVMLRAAERLGAAYTISKPFEPEELIGLLQSLE